MSYLPLLLVFVTLGSHVVTTYARNKQNMMPELGSPAFTAKFQIVIQDKGYHAYAIEKYDETKNKSSLAVMINGVTTEVIMDYNLHQVVTVSYNTATKEVSSCNISSMEFAQSHQGQGQVNFFQLFGGGKSPSSIPHMFSSRNIFSMNNENSFVQKDTRVIDGIEADHWAADMSMKESHASFTVHVYFTSDTWESAESIKTRVYPLRIEILGKKKVGTKTKPIHHYYEYLDFATSSRLPSDSFDMPEGASCTFFDNKVITPEPQIPDTITYSREVVDRLGNVKYADIVYDKNFGVMQINRESEEVLYDFNSGVRYQIKDRKCQIRAIDFHLDSNTKRDGDYVHDIGPAELYLLNKTFVYAGPKHTRLIDSLSYDGHIDGQPFDVHFGEMSWKFSGNSISPPLSMDRKGKHYNFFNFKATSASLRTDSLWGICRSTIGMKSLKMTFLAHHFPNNEDIFKDSTVASLSDAIAKHAGLNNVQVQIRLKSSHYDQNTRQLYLYVRLMGPPAAEYMYRHDENYAVFGTSIKPKTEKIPNTDKEKAIAKSAGLCEDNAATGTFKCRNFDLCKNGDGTYSVNMFHTLPANSDIRHSQNCDHFSRSVDGSTEVTLSSAYKTLKDVVKRGFLKIKWDRFTLTAVDVAPAWDRNTKRDTKQSKNKFKIVYPGTLTETKSTTTKTSEDCASKCLNNADYECKGFEYCYGTQQCLLSPSYPQKSNNKHSAKICLTFKRKYIADFQSMPGLTTEFISKDVYKNVQDANDCAMHCDQTKTFYCESFDFCNSSKDCLVSRTHAYSVPADKLVKAAPSCTHYSKNYLLDFDVTRGTTLSADDKHTLETISVTKPEQCAYLCMTGYAGKGCVQFDYCPGKHVCQIANRKTKSYVSHVSSLTCDTFTIKDVQRAVSSALLTSDDGTTYSNASFGGLAFAMVLVGMALGAAIIFVLHRQRILSRFIG